MRAIAALVSFLIAIPATASEEAARLAREASEALGAASVKLEAAEGARDRIAALTETIRAYETGLSALREGLRRAALSEREVEARLSAEDAELAELLVLLQTVTRAGEGRALFHPGGAVETIHAGLLASALVPALTERTAVLERDLADLEALRTVREAGIATLEDALEDVRTARLSLSRAISERTDLPEPEATDEAAIEALINSSETLAAFADSLVLSDETGRGERETWSPPVLGELVRTFDEADAGGVRRPGWMIGTKPEALVTAPADATVRFSGDMDESGPVIILETEPGTLAILTGHGRSFVHRDEIVSEGDPIALMGGGGPPAQENLIENALLGGQSRDETLYIEIRQGQAPVDPSTFFSPKQR
jgi:septal ring factor EnvC (AmiA/AmiB activator)